MTNREKFKKENKSLNDLDENEKAWAALLMLLALASNEEADKENKDAKERESE